ncbi:MAG: dienelactone hydrolase family protein [Gammaproteobacteria bacterium]|nr:dienelactone hydrolase family protein [Gammaproteobacteria bacterium]MDJ0891069.1 dienelactone hydrolase family protein [Gammaproteobacteria bacterium]
MIVATKAFARGCVCLLTGLLSLNAQGETDSKGTTPVVAADTVVGRALDAPVNTRSISEKFWWDDAWIERGALPMPVNHEVIEKNVAYANAADDTEVTRILYRPKAPGQYPAVLFQHGRRGLDELVQRLPRRMAARGFVVLAPDVCSARFIDKFPIGHMAETEGDTSAGVPLKRPSSP